MKTARPGPDVTQYKSINDANNWYELPELRKGNTEIWYARNTRDLGMGYKFLVKHGIPLPDPTNLKKTHSLMGKVTEKNPDRIFGVMQGEVWSPRGEAWDIVAKSGTQHTSMSVGDIIKAGSKVLLVDRTGFVDINTGKRMAAVMSPDDYRVLLAAE